jgi:hypothetical protein
MWIELLSMKVLPLIVGIHVPLSIVSVPKLLSIVLEVMIAVLLATTASTTLMHASSIFVLITWHEILAVQILLVEWLIITWLHFR